MNPTFGNNGRAKSTIARDILRVLTGTASLLMVALAAMQFSNEITWTLSDFVTAGILLAVVGIGYVVLAAQAKSTSQRLVIGALLGFVLLTIWAELAVGLL